MKPLHFISRAAFLLCFGFSGFAEATDFNITPTSGGGCSDATPNNCTIQEALNVAQNNGLPDTFFIAPGTYSNGGSAFSYVPGPADNKALTLSGAGATSTILEGVGSRVLSIDTTANAQDDNSDITLRGLTIRNGSVAGNGGGLFLHTAQADVTLENCVFFNNVVQDTGGLNDSGGGAFIQTNTTGAIFLTGNVFNENRADDLDGGLFLQSESGAINLTGNVFTRNNALKRRAGGLEVFSPSGNVALLNNIFLANSANSLNAEGGGAFLAADAGSLTLVHNTFAQNSANNEGGGLFVFLFFAAGGTAQIQNNIFFGNSAGGNGDDILVDDQGQMPGTPAQISHNLFSDFFCMGTCGAARVNTTDNLLGLDPQFADLAGGNLHLLAGSPAINAGNPNAPLPPATDFEGDPRTIGAAPDMGADEFSACGDGIASAGGGEQCDDSNTVDGDGCSSACLIEPAGGGGGGGSGGCGLLQSSTASRSAIIFLSFPLLMFFSQRRRNKPGSSNSTHPQT